MSEAKSVSTDRGASAVSLTVTVNVTNPEGAMAREVSFVFAGGVMMWTVEACRCHCWTE